MDHQETAAVLERAASPLLLEAGFARVGDRWSSRRGEAVRTVKFDSCRFGPNVLAGIGFVPALDLLKTAPPDLDLSCGTVPVTDLLQVYLSMALSTGAPPAPACGGPKRT